MPKALITKSFVDQLPVPKAGQVLYFDTRLVGFGLRVGSHAKSYFVQRFVTGSKAVRITIGRHGVFTPEQARKEAVQLLADMTRGVNPLAKRHAQQLAKKTLEELCAEYLQTHQNLKPRTRQEYAYYLKKYLPDWLNRCITEITEDDVIERHRYIWENHGPIVANTALRVLRSLMNHARVRYKTIKENPVNILTLARAWAPCRRRQTYIKPHQLKAWYEAVIGLSNDTYRDYLLVVLFTGMRKSEALRIEWKNIDLMARTMILTDTKNHEPLVLPLSSFLFNLLSARKERYKHHHSPYVFAGTGHTGHLAEPKKALAAVIEQSGVSFTMHDLRRTFITIAESMDISMYALKRLVNHKISHDVTGGYIVMDVERLREPAEKIAKFIEERIFNEPEC